jgi:hypothetical protein
MGPVAGVDFIVLHQHYHQLISADRRGLHQLKSILQTTALITINFETLVSAGERKPRVYIPFRRGGGVNRLLALVYRTVLLSRGVNPHYHRHSVLPGVLVKSKCEFALIFKTQQSLAPLNCSFLGEKEGWNTPSRFSTPRNRLYTSTFTAPDTFPH